MEPLIKDAYGHGGGMHGNEGDPPEKPTKTLARDTQSADGPVEPSIEPKPKHKPPPSTGDRNIDISGQSYIQ